MSGPTPPRYPFSTRKSVDPDPAALRLQADQPVARIRLASGHEAFLVTGYQDARAAYNDERLSSAAGAVPGAPTLMPGIQGVVGMFNMDPPDHTRLRRLVAKAFTLRSVEKLQPRVADIVDGLLGTMIAQGPPADLVAALADPLPVTVICEMLGIPFERRSALYDWVAVASSLEPVPLDQVAAASLRAYDCLAELFDERRTRPEDDLLTALLQVHEEGDRLSHDELMASVMLLFGTGQETTASHLTLSVLALFGHRDQWDLLVERPELVPRAVEELLRFVRLQDTALTRIAKSEVELPGGVVPAGSAVFVLTNTANRDPAVFTEPNRLHVNRSDSGQHLAFGQGIHYCLGAPLARLELRTALTGLVTRLPDLRLAVPEPDLEWNDHQVTGGLRALPVTW